MDGNKTIGCRARWTKAVVAPLMLAAVALVSGASMTAAQAQNAAGGASTASATVVSGRRFLGPVRQMGNGKVRSYVTLGQYGVPREIGMVWTQRALTGLPEEGEETEYVLPLPRLPQWAQPLAYDHLTMNWNPHGHDPDVIYGVPHFDFHFYMISEEQRDLISPADSNADLQPLPEYIPPAYFDTHGVVPRMGIHWIDGTSPELSPPFNFNSTFIYGFYQGDLIFQEPMVSLAYLQSKPNITLPFAQPQAFATSGFYPTNYSVNFDRRNKEYTVSLGGFSFRQGTDDLVD